MKWTKELVIQIAKSCPNVRHFHHYYRGAEKAAKRYGILDSLFPSKQIHAQAYSREDITKEASNYRKRSEFQLAKPSMYNAAVKLDLLKTLFPIQLNRKHSLEELKIRANKYETRSQFEAGDPNGYQIAQKRNLLDAICPPPTQGFSVAEKELLAFLQTLLSDFQPKRFHNDYELDCYSESLKLGIEYNGLYWHSEETKSKSYHIKKTKYFEGLGIRVVHVWEHEWRDRKDQVKDYLKSACGKNSIRIGARKCEFKEISSKEARDFLQKTHIQGAPNGVKYALGCFYKEILVGVCSFGLHHRNGVDMVLNRFACLPNHTVSGFLAKASSIAHKKFGTLLSWADYSKSQGKGYIAAGWELIKTHPPDYFYATTQAKFISKQSRSKKSVSTPPGMTECEHAKKDGLYRIWDCGKLVLQYKKAA